VSARTFRSAALARVFEVLRSILLHHCSYGINAHHSAKRTWIQHHRAELHELSGNLEVLPPRPPCRMLCAWLRVTQKHKRIGRLPCCSAAAVHITSDHLVSRSVVKLASRFRRSSPHLLHLDAYGKVSNGPRMAEKASVVLRKSRRRGMPSLELKSTRWESARPERRSVMCALLASAKRGQS
jgi:hypothetical protein